MAERNPGFEVVGGTEVEPRPAEDPHKVTIALVMLAVKTLSQRALTAVSDLFSLITVGGAWYLWLLTPDPTPQQIAHNSIFAVFILAVNYLVRRK